MSSETTRRIDEVSWSVSRAVGKGYFGCAWNTATGTEIHATEQLPSIDEVYAELKKELCRILNLPPTEPIESANGQRIP